MSDEDETVDTETSISEAMQHLHSHTPDIVSTECSPDDLEQEEVVRHFMTSGCGCTKARGMQCCEQFSPEYVTSARETCAEHTRSELDMAILGQLAAATNTSCTLPSGMLSTGRTHHAETEHERWYSSYFHQGKPVYKRCFAFSMA